MVQRLQTIEQGNHIIAVYPTKDERYNEAFAFLKEGLKRNEVVIITTTDLPKDEIRARMRDEWEVDVAELESRGDIIIRTTEEVYFPDGVPNIQRTKALWSTLVENCLNKEKKDCEYLETWEHFSRMALPKNYSNTNHVWNKDLTFLLSAYVHMILKISVIILH